MFEVFDGIEGRLSNLRQWLSIDGEPSNVPLLSAPIDPKRLQRAAEYEQDDDRDSRLEFSTVARSAKGYVANLKTTSSRLRAAREKDDGARILHLTRSINREKVVRAAALQDLAIGVAEKEVEAPLRDRSINTGARVLCFRFRPPRLRSVSRSSR